MKRATLSEIDHVKKATLSEIDNVERASLGEIDIVKNTTLSEIYIAKKGNIGISSMCVMIASTAVVVAWYGVYFFWG